MYSVLSCPLLPVISTKGEWNLRTRSPLYVESKVGKNSLLPPPVSPPEMTPSLPFYWAHRAFYSHICNPVP